MRKGLPEAAVIRAMDEAHELGIRLEVHQGLPIWEFMPMPWITLEIDRVKRSIRYEFVYPDMPIHFPDGSVRRPDLALFPHEPEPTLEPTRSLPEAVVEIVSPGSEIKDLELSPPFYLLHRIKDVTLFDPSTGAVAHFRRDGRTHRTSPVEIALECGCAVTV